MHERLKELLKARNLSKREFAKRLIVAVGGVDCMSEKTVYAYLSGKIRIRVDIIPRICDILDIAEQELFELSDKRRARILLWLIGNISKSEELLLLSKIGSLDMKSPAEGEANICVSLSKDDYYSSVDIVQIIELLKYGDH